MISKCVAPHRPFFITLLNPIKSARGNRFNCGGRCSLSLAGTNNNKSRSVDTDPMCRSGLSKGNDEAKARRGKREFLFTNPLRYV